MNSTAPLFLLILVVLAIAVVAVVIVLTLRKARKSAGTLPADADSGKPAAAGALSPNTAAKGVVLSFSRAMAFLRDHVAGRDYRYQVPWLLVMGPQGAGTSTLLAHAGSSAPLTRHGGPAFGVPAGPEWWFYERGLVLNVPGEMVRRADGRTSDQVGWFALLQLLVRRRARRPLDAVILAISSEDLLAAQAGDSSADLTSRAEVLCRKLAQLRRTLSMRLPVYLMVTKCDQVPGFSGFAAELPQELHSEIFGWSNPYPLDAAFSADWVDECCREMQRRIVEQQMEIFVERDQLQAPDDVFLFPAQFAALNAPLRQYLSFIFQPTAYQESYYFRGIYFCGDASVAAAAPRPEPVPALALAAGAGIAPDRSLTVAAQKGIRSEPRPSGSGEAVAPIANIPESRRCRPIFLNHLFERKIFPESILARPLSVIDMSRNRTVMTAKIATALFVLVAAIGTLASYVRLSSLKRDHLAPLFQLLASDVGKSDYRQMQAGPETPAEQDARQRIARDTNEVLRSMGLVSQSGFRSLFLPASWNNQVGRDMQVALARAFGTIVLGGFREGLTLQRNELIQSTTPAATDAAVVPVFDTFASVPQYQAWARYIIGLKELEDNIARYNRIAEPGGTGGVNDLKELLRYLKIDAELPEVDFTNPDFVHMVEDAVAPSFTLRTGELQGANNPVRHAQDLLQGFLAAWFGPSNRLTFDVDQMVTAIDRFPGRGAPVSYQELKDIADTISRVSDDLESPAFQWIADDEFDLSQYPALNLPVNNLQYLQGFQFASLVQARGEEAFRRFTADLALKSTRITGQVVGMDAVPVQVTGSVAAFEANLHILLDQIFVARDPASASRLDPSRPFWDRNTLLEASKLFDAYDKYERGSLPAVPPTMREVLQRVALDRLQGNVLDYVGEAQGPVPPGSPDGAAMQNFDQSLDVLQRLLTGFGKFSDPSAGRNFSSVLVSQASGMLVTLENELNGKNLYAVRDQRFDWWEGEKPLSLAAYDVSSADDLKSYLDSERDQISTLNQQADPLVKFLQPRSAALGSTEAKALADWRAISEQLKNYTEKTPGNSVLLLEDFIRSGMDKIAPDTSCQENTRDPAGRSDYFLARRALLRTGALARCNVLSQRAYSTQIASLFNSRLAGRFPFASAAPQTPFQEAVPGALVDFFGKFDEYGKIAAASLGASPAGLAPGNAQLAKSRDAALAFLSQMGSIRPVFAAFLMGADKNPVPGFDLAVNFRVNRGKEIEGNQIFDWSVEVGSQSFQYRAKPNTGHWNLGDPVRVTLRFASDSPFVPVADSNQPAMSVRQRTVTFEYTDPWSLFRLLVEHRPTAGEFDRGVDPTPETLSFYIPTAADNSLPQPKNGPSNGQVRVYLQISIVPPGGKEAVAVPLPFPAQAPALAGN
jgi:type VI secretion system protein ImpL